MRFALLLLVALCAGLSCVEPARSDDAEDLVINFNHTEYLIVLASSHDFPALKTQAEAIARKSSIPFDMQGMVYDAKRGLIVPDDSNDDMWRGYYVLRRNNLDYQTEKPFLSIEKSDAYPGLKPGYYFILAGICDSPARANAAAKPLRKIMPGLQIRKTTIYYGCMH